VKGIDDREFALPIYSPICTYCRHWWVGEGRKCDAYPVTIPEAIWTGEHNHRSSYPCDRGIRFEPRVKKPAD